MIRRVRDIGPIFRLPGLLLGMLLFALTAPAQAEISSGWVDGLNSRARLIAGQVTPPAGQPQDGLYVGVEIQLEKGWKTYWRTPGDAGIPPQFDWSASENVADRQVLYPAPTRYPDPAGSSIGYKRSVIFPVWIRPAQTGKPVTLKLTLDYGVCEKLCIPARAEMALLLPTTVAAALGPAPGLQASLEKVPGEAKKGSDAPRVTSVAIDTSSDPDRLLVEVSHPAGSGEADLFVEGPADWYLTLPKQTGKTAGKAGARSFSYAVPLDALPKDARLAGTELVFTIRNGEDAVLQRWTLRE